MKNKLSSMLLILMMASALLLVGCQSPKPAALSEEQVSQVAANILDAFNAGNYQSLIRDFSDQLKAVFTESEFAKLRDLLQNASGNYLSQSAPSLLNNQGYAVYRFPCKFEKEDVTVTITFKVGGDKVEGLFFDSINLRKLVK